MRWLVRLALLLCVILPAGLAEAEPRLALVIANGAYSGGMDPLTNPVNDGKLISGTLEKLGFTVTLVTDVDQKNMKRAISTFGKALEKAGPTTSALFYYAGHGLQVDGQNYLVPINAAIESEADVDLESVSADTVLKQMEYAAPSTSIVILDACRNNPLSRGMRSATRGLARMDAPNGSYVAYSTAPGQTAADGAGKNSPFATALAAEMVKPGQGIEEAFRNVRVNVSKATAGEQTPWDSSSLMNSFYFAGEKNQQVAAVAAPAPAAAPAATLDPAETAVWDSIKNSGEASDYAAYLEQYPNGAFAKLAESRQRSLSAKAAVPAPAVPSVAAITQATAVAAALEPDFESPLSDGTIVLSPKVKAALDTYLAAKLGSYSYKYFYVSKDGRQFGASGCENKTDNTGNFPTCGLGGDESIAKNRTRTKALSQCEGGGPSECILLYAKETEKNPWKPLQ